MAFFNYDLQERLLLLRFIIYLRKSTEDNEDKQMRSTKGQFEDIMEQVVKRFSLDISKILILEEHKSAFKPGREKFNNMLELIASGERDAIISWHPNRNARNYEDGGRFVQLMSNDQLKVLLTPHAIFENNPRDKGYLMDEFTRATVDSDEKSVMVKRGNKTKLNEGHIPSGRLREGYIHIRNEQGEFINGSDPDRFHLLRNAVELILDGTHKPKEALAILNDEWGYRTRKTKRTGGNPLSKSAWYSLLNDPKFYGKIERSEGKFNADFPKLMTQEEAQKIQILLGSRASRYHTKREWAYTGEIICNSCGGYVTMEEKWQIKCPNCKVKFHVAKDRFSCPNCEIDIEDMDNPGVFHYEWLHCGKSKKTKDGKRCPQPSVAVLDFEAQVEKLLDKITIPEKFTQWAIAWLRKLHKEEVKEQITIKKNLQKVDIDIHKQLGMLLDLLLRGSITPEEYDNKKAELQGEQKDVKTNVQKADKRAEDWLELCEKTYKFATYAIVWFKKGTNEQKRAILHALGSNLILDKQNLLIRQRKPFTILADNKEIIKILMDTFEPEELIAIASQKPDAHPSIPQLLASFGSSPPSIILAR